MADLLFQHLKCRMDAGVLVIDLLDSQVHGDELAEALRQELLAAQAHFGAGKIVLDFHNVKFLSSAGFRPLLSLHRKVTELRGRMLFCNLNKDTTEVFVVTRLISTSRSSTAPFQLAQDVPEAVARLKHHTSRTEQGVLVITINENRLHGDDLADSLSAELLNTVNQADADKVVLDFAQVQTISTPCMRPLLSLRTHLRPKGRRVILCNLDPFVTEVLTVTRLIAPDGSGPVPLESAADIPAAIRALNS
jgi:anti-anti-sigma factor